MKFGFLDLVNLEDHRSSLISSRVFESTEPGVPGKVCHEGEGDRAKVTNKTINPLLTLDFVNIEDFGECAVMEERKRGKCQAFMPQAT